MDTKISPREKFLLSQRNAIADKLKELQGDQTPNKCKEAELDRLRRRMAELDAELWPDGNKTEEMPLANNDNSFMPWDGAKSDDSLSESDLRELGRKDSQESPWKANETYSAYMSGISCDPSWQPVGVTYEDAGQDSTVWKEWEDEVKKDAARKPRKKRGGPGVRIELAPSPFDVPEEIVSRHYGEPMTASNFEQIYAEFVDELRQKRRNRYMDTDVNMIFNSRAW